MKKSIAAFFLFVSAIILIPGTKAQSVKLASPFNDHMVLQQNAKAPIWGWAQPGEKITIIPSWSDTIVVKADNASRWKAEIPTPKGGYTPQTLLIHGQSETGSVFLKDILIGEVWLASGQSNMFRTCRQLKIDHLDTEVGQANYPAIRIFNVARRASATPQDDLDGLWEVCTPDVMQNTSGTGYFFAKNLHLALDCPVGIMVDAWGGTPIEFWYPAKAFQDEPELVESAEKLKKIRSWPTSEPGTAYNAMTYPLGNYSIAGMIWYQGEANVFDPMTYARKMGVLVHERRHQFGSDLPVYFVQIAPYKYPGQPINSAWLRDQQRLALEIHNTGMVVTSDIGDTTDIHPGNKREVGRRLANLALKNTYHRLEGLVESPVFKKAVLYQGYVYIDFEYSDGLHFSEPERGYFEVADAKGVYLSVKAEVVQGKIRLDTRKIPGPEWVRFAFTHTATPVLFNSAGLPASCFAPQKIEAAPKVHMVSDLAHEFTFYADHRFDAQYLPGQKAVTNWCDLWHFDFSNANLLVLLGCDNRIGYTGQDIQTIESFLKSGGGVVVFGAEKSTSQNALLKHFGVEFTGTATPPLSASAKITPVAIEGTGGSVMRFESAAKWEVLLSDADHKAMMARKKVGKGTLLVASRSLSGSNPNAKDSINKEIWKPLLVETASGKAIDPNKPFRERGIEDLEYNDDHGTFRLSYNDYMKPFADAMVDVYKRSMPYVEKRMGVPLSPGMASQVTLLATGGGGFSSGTVVALAVWWGGFPDKEDSMIEFLTHESVHSWVLPFAEVWNEPIATYVGNLVMMDMGHEEEALRRIQRTIERAGKLDPTMKNYDLNGNLTGAGKELSDSERNNIHWGKSYWVLEQLRKEKPDIIAGYFQLKRELATPDRITEYDINNTVALLSKAMGRDLFDWFNEYGIPADRKKAEIK